MIINLSYDAAALAAPQSFRDDMQAAADMLDAHITNNITVNISVSYGTFNGVALPNQNTSEGGFGSGITESYSDLLNLLSTNETSADDVTAVDNLPSSLAQSFQISTAQGKALGVTNPNDTAIDGFVGMGTGFTGDTLFAGAIHELTHALGRTDGSSLDLFRFNEDNSLNRVFGRAIPAVPAYFSIDGGTTKLADFGINSDPGDFLNGGVQGVDPLNETVGGRGMTAVDMTIMDVLGFQVANAAPTVTALTGLASEDGPSFSRDLLSGAADPDGDSISITDLDSSVKTADGRSLSLGTDYTISGSTLSLTTAGFAKFNSLSAGTTDTIVFGYNVEDFLGADTHNTLALTINGVNDPPVIDLGASIVANSTGELPNVTNSSLIDSTPLGVVAFSDPDLNDRPTATLNTLGETVTWRDATHDFTSQLTPAQIATLEAAVSISAEAGNTNTGNIDWHYNIVDRDLDFLGVGETLTVTAPITIDDHNGGVITETVVVTINGADDNPVAAACSNDTSKGSTLAVSAAHGLLANDTDPDAHDQSHLFVGAVNGSATNVGGSVAGTYGTIHINADGSYVYVANKEGGLPSHIVAQDTFTYTVADGHGGTDTSTLSIIVTDPGVRYLTGANTTLIGGDGKQVLDGSAGHDVLIGGDSPDVLVGGAGDTMTGGRSPDTFLFRPDFGANIITDFDLHNDTIQLDRSIFSSVADLLSHTTNTSAGAVINDTHGDTITLANVTLEQLQAHQSSFHLV